MGAPVDFPEATRTLTAPHGLEDQVRPLRVAQGNHQLVSCWELTADEVAEVQATGLVWLSVWGAVTQPPVFVTGHKHEVISGDPPPNEES